VSGYEGTRALPRAHGEPLGPGTIRSRPEDFAVEEELSFHPAGEGEHVYLFVEKSGRNTEEVARDIARIAGVRPRDVGFAGLKDRNARTRQWFSVVPRDTAGVDALRGGGPGWNVLEATRHGRKLRRGAIARNGFAIVVRDVDAPADAMVARLERLAHAGVPNYFGPQRFGRDAGNLDRARALLDGTLRERDRHRRGLYLSAARSELFNAVCARRVAQDCWDRAVEGDVMMLDGSHSVFVADAVDEALAARVAAFDLHPTGPLPGRGGVSARASALALERSVLDGYSEIESGLVRLGLELDRRALRLPVRDMAWDWPTARELVLRFSLPPGGYATTVLRELVDLTGP